MHGILPDDYYQHHLLLVEGIYLLLKDVVEECDILQSSRLLSHYCYLYPIMYGKDINYIPMALIFQYKGAHYLLLDYNPCLDHMP